jgi:hypothetical protein
VGGHGDERVASGNGIAKLAYHVLGSPKLSAKVVKLGAKRGDLIV